MDLDGRVAIVTGASMGIGRRVALDLAERGATVVGVARGADALATLELGEGWTRSVDVGDAEAVRGLVDDVVAKHGRLDILINNAAIERRRSAVEMDLAFVREHLRVNFEGTVAATLAAVPHMVARGEGWIASVISGVVRAPVPFEAAYAASKAAVAAFSEAISYELAPKGVRIKILSPGFVGETRMATATVADGFPVPPRLVHRTPAQVSAALLRGLDAPGFEINVARAESLAPVMRALFPRLFRRGVARTQRV